MARRRYRKNQGLIEIALTSNWKVAATLAAGSAFGGAVVIPALFGRSAMLAPVAAMLVPLAWFIAAIFFVIALGRFMKQQTAAETPSSFHHRTDGHGLAVQTSRRPAPPAGSAVLANRIEPRESRATTEAFPSRPDAWSLDVLDRIEWKRFEDVCCAFYREKGIRAETTVLGPDGGVDVRLFQDDADPTRVTSIVQCKAWNQQVGVKPVRELRGVMAHEKVHKAFFMAPNGYTDDARAFAAENRITLLDGKLILAMLQRLPAESSRRLLEFATEGDWTTPTCPKCGERMTGRESRRGPFWGCTTYPKCAGKLPMRAQTSR
ncbi:MAG: restriction endonuclease [Aromatoleum sp.]|jgi:restriction system protein|uniref:restriction endonuclease n=1 Tax=Aromatoleum sp. TaxID=2307007 RepID=UPI002894F899|nr:restriction endonuclease [Aromatoleum sp.]MDT3672563.1 restriction endonuclease [Aromatoleum sp.]